MQDGGNIVVVGGLVIGLAYGAIGLLSGFCLLSGLRGWWAEGDTRLIRTFALALGLPLPQPSFSPLAMSSISANRSICSRRSRRR